MELDLDSARLQREVEGRIRDEFDRLTPVARKASLERVVVDVLASLSVKPSQSYSIKIPIARPIPAAGSVPAPEGHRAPTAGRPPVPPKTQQKFPEVTSTDGDEEKAGKKLWEKILAYCQAHPAPRYRTVELAAALMPERSGQDERNVANSMIVTACKRRSTDESEDPYFVILGNGYVRLATDDERAKAQEDRS